MDATSTTASTTSNRAKTREMLLRKKVIPLDEFKRIRALGLKVEKRAGDAVVPIPVPLKPGESVREYEAAMHRWLQAKGVFLRNLRDDPHRKRNFRTAYADTRAEPTDHYRRDDFLLSNFCTSAQIFPSYRVVICRSQTRERFVTRLLLAEV
ncbi:hypothetical protein Gpo141_00000792 [Globisporangium polare]